MFSLYPETLTGAKIIQRSQQKHIERLGEIRNKPSDRIDNSQPRKKKTQALSQTKAERQRSEHINRENKKMLLKIEEIINSNRKQIIPQTGPITLNYNARKQKVTQILNENKALMRRISSTIPHFSIRQLLKDPKPAFPQPRKHYLSQALSVPKLKINSQRNNSLKWD